MNYDEAIKFVKVKKKVVKRPNWHKDLSIKLVYDQIRYYNSNLSSSRSLYIPTREDKRASDWQLCEEVED